MKIFNKFIWSKKEPSNKNDIWFDGSTWRMYTEEAWQSFTLPVDAADTVVKMLENASEVYQEKLNAGYGIIIEGNTISLDVSSIDIDTTHNIGSIELFDQLIKDRSRYKLHEDDIKAIQEGKLITTTKFGTKIPVLSVNHMVQSSTSTSIVGYTLTFYVDTVLYNMSIYDFEIVGGLSWKTHLDSLAPDSNFISNSYNAIQNAIVTKKFEETDAKFTELEEQTTEQLAELSEEIEEIKENQGSGNSPIGYGDATHSAVLKGEYQGYKNKAISKTSMAIGAATTAGLKGWYYSAIDFASKEITLSDRPTYILVGETLINGGWSSGVPNIKVDDVISLVNDSKYDLCSIVTAVNGNVISVASLPFTGLVIDSGASLAVLAGQFSDGYSVYIPDRPDAGIIDFGGGAFSEGSLSKATNIASHAEGLQTHAYGQYSHTEGRETKAGYSAHAEGRGTVASREYSHAEGYYSKSEGLYSHAEGSYTTAGGNYSHVEGNYTKALGASSHAEGSTTVAEGNQSHAEGLSTIASGENSHAEGAASVAYGLHSHAEGYNTNATKEASHSEGKATRAKGAYSHAEGSQTQALGTTSHAEGESTISEGNESHAEGFKTVSSGLRSHAEGDSTKATQQGAHSEGARTSAEGVASHAEGVDTKALGRASHVEGDRTITNNNAEHASGKYNNSIKAEDKAQSTHFSIGIGTSDTNRKNAVEVKANGDVYIIGVGGYDGTNSASAQTLQEILANL